MVNLYDIAYGIGLGISAPFWLLKGAARKKVLAALRQRMGHVPRRGGTAPAVLIHAVSLGEINATRGLVQRLRELRPELHVVISSTTDTGFARAQELYGSGIGNRAPGIGNAAPPDTRDPKPDTRSATPDVTVIRYPLDFSSAIARVLDDLRPSAVVLMELEAWPNFIHQCAKRSIPVIVVNGRITEPSFRRYRLIGPVVWRMFSRLAACCVQDQVNAERFLGLGVPAERVQITGTMKFDTATVAPRVSGDDELAAAVGLQLGEEPVWVCGSTGPGEEAIVLEQYRKLLESHPRLRLVIVPRHPQRFDEVAELIRRSGLGALRRSTASSAEERAQRPVILGDTMGELRKFYSLGTVIFVGRTLVDLGPRQHGSDMIEPAALGKPVIVGPYTTNFADAMSQFAAAGAMVRVATGEELGNAVRELLDDPKRTDSLADAARDVVVRGKGATERHAQVILRHL